MKKILGMLAEAHRKVFGAFQGKSTQQLILMSLAFLVGLMWPLGGLLILIGSLFYKQVKDYGTIAITGAVINYVLYFVQVALRIAAQL